MGSSHAEDAQLREFIIEVASYAQGANLECAALLAEACAPVRSSQSLRGLREATRDVVEMLQDLPYEVVLELDRHLLTQGLPSLSAMRDRRYRFLLRVLSRGRINTEEECRLLDAYTSDSDCPGLTPNQRTLAERLLAEFHAG